MQNFNGRAVEQNIGETTRHGAELALDADWDGGFSARLAYTYIRAIVAQAYATCVGTPCKSAIVESGSYLPAVPLNALYAGLTWSYARSGSRQRSRSRVARRSTPTTATQPPPRAIG